MNINPEDYILEDVWTLWFHSKNNRNWDINSYTKVCEIRTIKDFWNVYGCIKNFTTEMYFLMKGNILPQWETDDNKYGGSWSIDIDRNIANDVWKNISLLLVGCTLNSQNDEEIYDDINGISIKPKYASSIVKVWTKSITDLSYDKYFNAAELSQIINNTNECISFAKY